MFNIFEICKCVNIMAWELFFPQYVQIYLCFVAVKEDQLL